MEELFIFVNLKEFIGDHEAIAEGTVKDDKVICIWPVLSACK